MLRVKLPHLDRWIEARQAAARRYDALIEENHLGQLPAIGRSSGRSAGTRSTSTSCAWPTASATPWCRHLKAERIGCEIYYPVPLHLQECLAYLGHREGDFPVSEEACRCVLALPMFPEITAEQQRRVIGSCASFVRERHRMAA